MPEETLEQSPTDIVLRSNHIDFSLSKLIPFIENPAFRLKLSQWFLSRGTPMSEKRSYPSTELSTDQRELIARLVGPLEVRGISRSVFRDILAEAGITVPKSSLDRWARASVTTGKIFTAEKASGAVPLLDNDVRLRPVVSQNDANQIVSLASFAKFCASAFGVELAQTTAHDYLHALGFSSKVSQVKTKGFTVDVDALAKMMFEWKSERQRVGYLKGLLASVDFTFTGHRTDLRVTYAPVLNQNQVLQSLGLRTALSPLSGPTV
jgi:transposase